MAVEGLGDALRGSVARRRAAVDRVVTLGDKVTTILGVTVPAVAVVIAAVFTWNRLTTWGDIAVLAGMYLPTSVGTTVGFHRMLTHRSFDAHVIVRFVLLALGCMAGQGNPVRWSAIHLQHHSRSDRDGDPHSPLNGLFHAHMGWFLPGFDHDADTYARGVRDDPLVRFFQRTYVFWAVMSQLIPLAIGGWTGLLWGGGVRLFFTLHVTFSVNSICHTFGRVEYATSDRSRNNWLFGVIAFGEGWHNNHHAFPRSAFHGLRWWQIDTSGYIILGLERLGLARNVHRVTPQLMSARRLN